MKQTTPSLSPERILAAALNLADEGGIAAVSMRKLAESLGVKAMSLYNHIPDKEALLDAMVDAVAVTMPPPVFSADWKTAMMVRARGMRRSLLRHRWAVPLMMSRINVGPAMLRHVNATLGCLRQAGFSVKEADKIWNLMDSQIFGFTLLEIHAPIQPPDYANKAGEYLPKLPPENYPHLRELAEAVAGGSYSGINDFEEGFRFILQGVDIKKADRILK